MLARLLCGFLYAVLVVGSSPALAQSQPAERVEVLNAALLDVMKSAESLGFEGRYKRLRPALEQTFDFEEMARVTAGRFWSDFSAEERERYVDAFTRMSVATFAARFDGYSGEKFEIVGEKPGSRGSVTVETRIVQPSGDPVAINYLLRQTDAGWRIVDIYLQSTYSEVAVKRSEYTSILGREGLDGLIAALDRKIDDLRS